jgi:hypothetical protein
MARAGILVHSGLIQPSLDLEDCLRTCIFTVLMWTLIGFTLGVQAQQVDAAFGVGTLTGTSSNNANTFANFSQSLSGGAYLNFSGDALIKGNFGVQGEVAWRASRNLYAGFQPYRPVIWDFNAIYAPRFNQHLGAELMGGIGAESLRFYQNFFNCGFTGCTNYTTSTHFLGHFGGGIRLYPVGNFFIRPEAHIYLINNNHEFSSNYATRYGMSIGYTFGGR